MDSDGISQFRYDFIIFKLVNTIRVCYKSSYFNGSFSYYAKVPNYDQKKGKRTCLSERSVCSVEHQDNMDAYFNLSVIMFSKFDNTSSFKDINAFLSFRIYPPSF